MRSSTSRRVRWIACVHTTCDSNEKRFIAAIVERCDAASGSRVRRDLPNDCNVVVRRHAPCAVALVTPRPRDDKCMIADFNRAIRVRACRSPVCPMYQRRCRTGGNNDRPGFCHVHRCDLSDAHRRWLLRLKSACAAAGRSTRHAPCDDYRRDRPSMVVHPSFAMPIH
jgi:hypothetical protein